MKHPLCPLLLAAALALSCGCDSTAQRNPKTTQNVVLSAEHAAQDVEMEIVSAIRVVLPPGPQGSAGDDWVIAANNARVLEQMGPLKPDPAMPGFTTVSFYALKPGRSVLRFVLVRPGEAESVPAATCEVTVRVSD
jgi:hypothetical protein